jgi:hypothetical protein
MPDFTAAWPDDADGGVFRNLAANEFDFSARHSVDYNVDFVSWPPATAALEWLRAHYGDISLYAPTEDMGGYVQFQVFGRLTYEGATSTQRRVSTAMAPFGGACESWGVMHNVA